MIWVRAWAPHDAEVRGRTLATACCCDLSATWHQPPVAAALQGASKCAPTHMNYKPSCQERSAAIRGALHWFSVPITVLLGCRSKVFVNKAPAGRPASSTARAALLHSVLTLLLLCAANKLPQAYSTPACTPGLAAWQGLRVTFRSKQRRTPSYNTPKPLTLPVRFHEAVPLPLRDVGNDAPHLRGRTDAAWEPRGYPLALAFCGICMKW